MPDRRTGRCSSKIVACLAMLALVIPVGLAGCSTLAGTGKLSKRVSRIVESPEFSHSPWAIYVTDLETGKTDYESYNPDAMLDSASTTKCFTVSTALDVLGKDYKFKTPVYSDGQVSGGTLTGDLILVASGDISLGGRTLPDGRIEYTDMDHTDANALGTAILTKTDPLAGLNALAGQVAASGVKRVSGNVIIDDRMYGPVDPFNPGSDYKLTPIMVNDNVIDLIMAPGMKGGTVTVDWRPRTSAFRVEPDVTTGPAGSEAQLEVDSPSPGVITVKGQIPQGGGQVVRTYPVPDPSSFARTLFVEAMARAGITVQAPAGGPNPSEKLPAASSYGGMTRAAELVSPPFSEYAKLVLKVSHNPGADTCLLLVASKKGKKTMEDGLAQEKEFLARAGINTAGVMLNDGQGSEGGSYIAPSTMTKLLRYMETRKDFKEFFAALPVMGVDGSLANTMKNSKVKGKAQAKTGTHAGADGINGGLYISRALAGYVTAKSGKQLVYDIVVSQVPVSGMKDMQVVNDKHAAILEAIYEEY